MAGGIVYIKSLMWLIGLGGLGYGLMVLTTPSKEKIDEIKLKGGVYSSEDEKRKVLFLNRLREATEDTPIYLKKSENNKKN